MNLNQKQKSAAFDAIISLLDKEKLEMLFKADHAGQLDYESVTDSTTLFDVLTRDITK